MLNVNQHSIKVCNVASRNREEVTDFISLQILKYSQQIGTDLQPMKVHERLNENELCEHFLKRVLSTVSKPTSDDGFIEHLKYGDDLDVQDCPSGRESRSSSNNSLNGDSSRDSPVILAGVSAISVVNSRKQTKQESLLKPKAERLSLPKEDTDNVIPRSVVNEGESVSKPSQQPINIGRMKLKEALKKARSEGTLIPPNTMPAIPAKRTKEQKTPSPDMKTRAQKSKSRSKSRSPTSSDDTFEYPELPPEEVEATELSKEPFLRLFGLYTHAFSNYLKTRRMERRRRNCTSTERGDFHYGRLDLFEKQHSRKGNRQFLYSPPATRAKRRRATVITTNGAEPVTAAAAAASASRSFREKVAKTVAATLNSRSDFNEKVCLTCFKKGMSSFSYSVAENGYNFHYKCQINVNLFFPQNIY